MRYIPQRHFYTAGFAVHITLGLTGAHVMHPPVSKYIKQLSGESRQRGSDHFKAEVEEFVLLVQKLNVTLSSYHSSNQRSKPENPRHFAFALMTRGASTLMAAFELTITGYAGEPEILLRSALERFAVAWDIVHNPDRFVAWKQDQKFDSTLSISRLKQAIEPIGKMYGYLSNSHVHITPKHYSPSMYLEDGVHKFQFFGYVPSGKEDLRNGGVYHALFYAYVFLQLTELVFHNYCDEFETIEKIPGQDHVRTVVSKRHQKFRDLGIDYFRLMSTDPAATL